MIRCERPIACKSTLRRCRFPTGMRGQSLAYSVAGTLLSCSPQPPLAGCGSVRQSSSALLPVRSFRLGTAFCSPAATDLFRDPPRRGQCSRPVPSSEFGTLLPARSAISSHPGSAFSRLPGCSSPVARCRLASPKLSNFHPTFTSLQDFHPSRSQRSVGGLV